MPKLRDPETCSWCTVEVEDALLIEQSDGARLCPDCSLGQDVPCAACNAEPGEPCRVGCVGKAAHQDRLHDR